MQKKLQKSNSINRSWYTAGWFLFALIHIAFFCLLIRNVNMPGFIDESDNMLSGFMINKGYMPYRDFFSHHMPITYYLSALFQALFDIRSAAGYRQAFALFCVLYLITVFFFIRRRQKSIRFYAAYLIFELVFVAILPRYMGYMLLSDCVVALAYIPLILCVIYIPSLDFTRTERIVISLSIFAALMGTAYSVYPVAVLFFYYIAVRYRQYKKLNKLHRSEFWMGEIKFLMTLLAPFFVYGLYLFVTGTLDDFIQSAIMFNLVHYSKFTPDASIYGAFSGIGKSLSSVAESISSMLQSRTLDMNAMSNVVLIIILSINIFSLYKADPLRAAFAFLFALMAFTRGGFHHLPFAVSVICMSFALLSPHVNKKERSSSSLQKKSLQFAAVYAIVLCTISLFEFKYQSSFGAWHSQDLGNNSESIYAAYVETLTDPGDTIWMAPTDPALYLQTNRMPASYAQFYLPWQADDPEIEARLLSDLEEKKPKLIVFETNIEIWGFRLGDYAEAIHSYIKENYHVFTENSHEANIYIRNDYYNEAWLKWTQSTQ